MKNKHSKGKHGFTVVEIVAALALLTACIVAFSQLFVFVTSQRNAEEIRQAAVDQLQNVREQLRGISDEKLAALDFDRSDFEQTTRRALPGGEIEFSTESATPAPGADSTMQSDVLQITVSWDRGEKRPRGEVSLFRLLTPTREGETEQ